MSSATKLPRALWPEEEPLNNGTSVFVCSLELYTTGTEMPREFSSTDENWYLNIEKWIR